MELEFSVFRASRQSTLARLKGRLSGAHSQEQYRDFIKVLLTRELGTFFREYPVLARLVAVVIDMWVDAIKEFLWRLEADKLEIQSTFQGESELGQVVTVQPFLSDRHHNGRSVTAVQFASGLKLIYKPKNLDIEQAYFKLLAWLNEHNVPLPFKLLQVLNRSTYGWVEFAEAKPCKDKEEAIAYYQRFGELLCLVHVLQAADLHFQNIIACGEYPTLIDLETLMHPWVQEVKDPKVTTKVQYVAFEQMEHSVLRTGLLPKWQFGLENQSFDFSGLEGGSQQKTPFRLQKWRNINTDNMVLGYEYRKAPPSANKPSLDGVNLAINDYAEEIVDGFQQMYRFLMEHREAILATDGPMTALAHQPIRVIFRSTSIYSLISARTLDPKFLRDGAERSIQFDLLSRLMLLSETKPLFWSLLREEQQALEQLDIPLFTARADSDSLTLAPNRTIEKCFTAASFNLVVSCLHQLNDQDLEQQIGFIRGSIYSRIASEAHRGSRVQNTSLNLDAVTNLTKQEMVQQAMAIATGLQKQAIRSADGSATWIAPQYIFEVQRFQLQPMGYGLYDGVSSLAFFLAALEKVTSGAGFHDLALGVLQPLCQDLHSPESDLIAEELGLGAAVGCGSLIYGLVRISQFLEEPALLQAARKVAFLITPELIAADRKFDIISGSAGAILGLLALYDISAERDVLEQAIACGHHLLNHRVNTDSGYRAWKTLNGKLLTGFSHGAAGIAYALLRLYQVTRKSAFLAASLEAIAYENSVFIPEVGNWSDLRSLQTDGYSCMCSWCNGAAGIGLARVATLDILDTDAIRQDIQAAVNTTKQINLRFKDHLCCGNLGRVEFLFTTARKLSQPQLLEIAIKQAAQVVARAKQRGAFSYGASLAYHPGLFQGSAGIGYELLRLAEPDLLPSVLLWE